MSNVSRPAALALALAATLLAACAAIQQQKAEAARADQGEFHNLKILPQNITHDELISTMRGFTRALGVRCDHCHAANPPGSKEQFDFPSDAKPEKEVARTMLRMTRADNVEYLSKINAHGQTVMCMTCHRGHTVPEVTVAVPESAPPPPPPTP